MWEMEFRKIKDGELAIEDMMKQIEGTIRETISTAEPISIAGTGEGKAKKAAPKAGKGDVKCPKCGSKMILRNGKNGAFWGCANYPDCKATADDQDGKPVFKKK